MGSNTSHVMSSASSIRDSVEPFSPADEVYRFAQLTRFYDGADELGHVLEGQQYGFEALSFMMIEVRPGDGPPLHSHPSEAAHIALAGTATYVLDDQRFTVAGPYVVKIPAGVPHTFLNIGGEPMRLIIVFADSRLSWDALGPNPLPEA
jgi:quercetin dioxygenase-like cupin family protein